MSAKQLRSWLEEHGVKVSETQLFLIAIKARTVGCLQIQRSLPEFPKQTSCLF